MAISRADIINNLLAVMLANQSELDSLTAKTALAEEMADSIINGAPEPIYIWQYNNDSGFYHNFLEGVSQYINSNGFIVPDRLYGYPIVIKKEVELSELRLVINPAVVGNSVWGIYDSTMGYPNNLIIQAPIIDNGITGIQSKLFTNTTIPPGIYYVGYNSSSQPTLRGLPALNVANILGDNSGFTGTKTLIYRPYTYTGALPASFGTPTSFSYSNVPYIQFKVN